MSTRPRIAIDIDDVLADTHTASKLWIEAQAGVPADFHGYTTHTDYWDYYNRVIMMHGNSSVRFEDFLAELARDQAHVPLLAGAQFAIQQLMQDYDVVLITARDPSLEAATRAWLDSHFDSPIPLHLSSNPLVESTHRTKGEICRDLGVSVLIDDNTANCKSALDHGVKAILFGDYIWQVDPPANAARARDWPAVLEVIHELI